MLLSKTALVTWNSENKKHYTDLGYKYTKMRECFTVNVEDLTVGSIAIVEVKCDYCGVVFEVMWQDHCKQIRSAVKKHACGNIACLENKSREVLTLKYGERGLRSTEISNKRDATNIRKYGHANVFANDDIKRKIVETNLKKYGVEHNQQSKEIRAKTMKTCMERYGVENYVELFAGKYIGENSPNWKGGVEHSRVERATYEYRQWRSGVFGRDRYVCQCCGIHPTKADNKNGIELNAHHIRNWRDNEDDRYDIDNGITLCSVCHNKFHGIYGKRNNTPEQLYEFLGLDKKIC